MGRSSVGLVTDDAYCAAIGKFSKDSLVDAREAGDRVRESVLFGSKRFSEGDLAEMGRRAEQNVSLSLINSCTYLERWDQPSDLLRAERVYERGAALTSLHY